MVNLRRADTTDLVLTAMALDPFGFHCDDRSSAAYQMVCLMDARSQVRSQRLFAILFHFCGRVSMHEYHMESDNGTTFLTRTTEAWWRVAPGKDEGLSLNLLELCAGSGAMGLGASFLGGKVSVAVDNNIQ